jgi:hypothetical protein
MADIIATESTNAKDLKITFEVSGDDYVLYVKESAITTMDKNDIINALKSQLECALRCSSKASFGACVARCLLDGQVCDGGVDNCSE